MSNYDLEEDVLLKFQIYLSIIFIFTLIVSISLSYNSMMDYEGKNKIYSDDEALNILRINRIISFLVAFGFVLINVFDKNVKEKYDFDIGSADLQIAASVITLVSSLIVLYVAFNNNSSIISNENPEI
ncbi:MAG: hypothetical protein IKF91_01225 [Bacilli bacterium]|nr:hypothetical protein [Bacilli bacterium]